jgi:hypothetical protein
MGSDRITEPDGIVKRYLPSGTEREIEFSLSLLRMATAGQSDSAQRDSIEQLLSTAQASERP